MKERIRLRNKKTGQIVDLIGTERSCPYITIGIDSHDGNPKTFSYTSIEQLNEEWEDVKEPLIEDEKIRKAVRAWAEANDIDGASFYTSSHFWYLRTFNDREQGIDFWLKWDDKPNLIESKYYTIAELCGEEEA